MRPRERKRERGGIWNRERDEGEIVLKKSTLIFSGTDVAEERDE